MNPNQQRDRVQGAGMNGSAAAPEGWHSAGAPPSTRAIPAVSACSSQDGAPTSWRATDPGPAPGSDLPELRARERAPCIVFVLAALLILASLALMLFPGIHLPLFQELEPSLQPEMDRRFGLVLLIACLLPPVLAWLSYLLINKRAMCEHIRPCFPADLEPELAAIVQAAHASWAYEIERVRWCLSRAQVFAGMWGMMTSLSIASAMLPLLPPFHTLGTDFVGPSSVVGLAVIGSASTSFLLDLARLSIRTSNDDATKRMFAEALRTLILSVVSTLALVLLVRALGPKDLSELLFTKGGPQATLVAIGVGAAVAITGPLVFEWIQARFAALLGINQRKPSSATPLDALDDISDAESARLAEEGIVSVEALIGTPIARLALSTRFSLQRISDWHDCGLLITRVGKAPARDLRARWGIRSSIEIRRLVRHAGKSDAKVLRGIFKKALRVDGDAEAGLVLEQIAKDERVALTEVLRRTLLQRRPHGRPVPAQTAEATLWSSLRLRSS